MRSCQGVFQAYVTCFQPQDGTVSNVKEVLWYISCFDATVQTILLEGIVYLSRELKGKG